MWMSFLRSWFGTSSERHIRKLYPILEVVRQYEAKCVRMSNDELRAHTARFKERLTPVLRRHRAEVDAQDLDDDIYR